MISGKFNTTRRDFIRTSGLATLGLLVGLDSRANVVIAMESSSFNGDVEINPFILIGTDNTVTIINPRPCMGQGTIQSVPAMIAEELEVDLAEVTIIQSDGKGKYGSQTSGGSSSIRKLWLPLRKAGAATKEMLIQAAAKKWNVSPGECYASRARVYRKNSASSFTYGELIEAAVRLPVPHDPVLKQKHEFTILGKTQKRFDIADRLTGKAVYGIDVDIPGMLYASILHSPMIFGKIIAIDDAAALKVPGLIRVLRCERKMIHRDTESVAVVASN
jgi:isoquinoline 1-oxidoreductase beta subunit